MSIYTPNNWIILEIDNKYEHVYYKVLAGWSGGYLDGDSWKLNSGIVEVKDVGKYYDFVGTSGSVYHCHKGQEQVRMNTSGVLNELLGKFPDTIKEVLYKDIKDLI